MSETGLMATAPLDGFAFSGDGISVEAVEDLAIVAVSVPGDGQAALGEALQAGYDLEWPGTGRSSGERTRLIGLSPDQAFLIFRHDGHGAEAVVAGKLGETAYLFDQSDAWAVLRMEGARCRAALERICMLDLDDAAFPEGAPAARRWSTFRSSCCARGRRAGC
ncbi:MAG: hypothetical protein ACMVY4_14565 [Minwuia sp.]|uniref:hypothetical protein n=1 Tax=Minwuia sp. TaxID=2493630 RepID=UPI003A85660C